MSGPCDPWVAWDDLEDVCTPPDLEEWVQDAIIEGTTRELWEKTCRQYGTCTTTVRPLACCAHGTWDGIGAGRGLRCSCDRYPYVLLSKDPIVDVEQVTIDGELFADYRVDEEQRLVRVDGLSWPRCNSLLAENTEPGTFEVTFTFGTPVPDMGRLAAALIACQWANGIAEGTCGIPANATTIAREGVTIELRPPTTSTGHALVDEWLQGFRCGSGGIFDPGAARRFVRLGDHTGPGS